MKLKKAIGLIIVCIIICFPQFGGSLGICQVAINTTGAVPDNSASLDVSSTTKGILVPRMTKAQRNAIASPAQSLFIYVIDDSCYEGYMGHTWQSLWCSSVCALPAQPASITGLNPVSHGSSGISYSVPAVAGVVEYIWTYSGTGFSISSGSGGNTISANFSNSASIGANTLSVYGLNACGVGKASTITVTVY